MTDKRADSASYDELWDALTPAEREKFLRAVNDPESELAKQLLASEELEREQIEPWWEAVADVEADAHINPPATPSPRKHGSKPPIMHIPEPLVKQSARAVASGTVLLYNICALWQVYLIHTHVTKGADMVFKYSICLRSPPLCSVAFILAPPD